MGTTPHSQHDPILLAYFRTGTEVTPTKGELVVRATDDPDYLFFVENGFVKVYTLTARGEEYVHLIYGRGEVFPAIWLHRPNRRNMSYEALTACKLWRVPSAQLIKDIQHDIHLSNALLFQIVDQFKVFGDRIDNLEFKFARERLAYRLLYLASRFGVPSEGGYMLEMPLTQQLIASSINMSRENVSREFEKLARHGYVAYENRSIRIKNVEGLMNELKEPISPDWWGLKRPPREL